MRGHSLPKTGEFSSAISDYTKAIQAKLKREGHDAANSFVYRAEAYTKKQGTKGLRAEAMLLTSAYIS